jgi:hypothetical protein
LATGRWRNCWKYLAAFRRDFMRWSADCARIDDQG